MSFCSGLSAAIWIVDEHPEPLRELCQTLTHRGYQVRFQTGHSALSSVLHNGSQHPQFQPLDLLVIGPGLWPNLTTGIWGPALQRLGNLGCPWVAIGQVSQPEQRIALFRLGGADYLECPLHLHEAIVRLERQLILQRQRAELQTQIQQLQRDMRDYHRVEMEMQLLLALTQAITEATEIEGAFHAVLDCVYHTIGWDYGEIWMPDPNRNHLAMTRSHYAISDLALSEFDDASQSFVFERDHGVVGRVWQTGRPLWIEDATKIQDAFFVRQELVLRAGLRTNLSVPIIANGQILAVLCLFHRVAMPCDGRLIKLMGAVAAQMGVLLQRKKAELELRRANLQLEVLAKLDGLTQIPNRRCFDHYLLREWQRLAQNRCLIGVGLCDVDHFKQYNDAYGHQAGDECLVQVARALSHAVSESANLVARYGGEEFAIVFSDTNLEQVKAIAHTIQQAIAQLALAHAQSSVSEHITLSMGFAIASPHLPDSSPDELLRWADQALYQAKYAGRNQFRVAALSRAVCEGCEEVGNEIDPGIGQAIDPDRCKEVCPGVCELEISAS